MPIAGSRQPMTQPVQLDEGACRRLLGDPDTPAFVLLTIAMWALGPIVLGDPDGDVDAEDPAEVVAALYDRFDVWITDEGQNKLNAITMALQGDLFYRDVDVFNAVVTALPDGDLGDLIDNEMASDITLADIMWAMLEVDIAAGHDADTRPKFSPGVQAIVDREFTQSQEDMTEVYAEVSAAFDAVLSGLRDIGVPDGMISMITVHDPDENPVVQVS